MQQTADSPCPSYDRLRSPSRTRLPRRTPSPSVSSYFNYSDDILSDSGCAEPQIPEAAPVAAPAAEEAPKVDAEAAPAADAVQAAKPDDSAAAAQKATSPKKDKANNIFDK
jgi:hypothetical protein